VPFFLPSQLALHNLATSLELTVALLLNLDVWSTGCVMAELMLGQPLFPGESGIDQLVEIIKVLGTPTREQIRTMNPNYMEHKFPQIKPHPFNKVCIHPSLGHSLLSRTDHYQVFRKAPPEAIDLISALLEYTPTQRLSAIEAMCHPFFDELRDPATRLPDSRHHNNPAKDLPALFDFSRHGEFPSIVLCRAILLWIINHCFSVLMPLFFPFILLILLTIPELSIAPQLNEQIVPPHARPALEARGLDINNFKPLSREEMQAQLD